MESIKYRGYILYTKKAVPVSIHAIGNQTTKHF